MRIYISVVGISLLVVTACQAGSNDTAEERDVIDSPDPASPTDPADTDGHSDSADPDGSRAESADPPWPDGNYSVTGENPDGSTYAGTLSITSAENHLEITWDTEDVYEGLGMVAGNRLITSWGETCSTMHYERNDDATLSGTWIQGEEMPDVGTEQATPTGTTAGFPGSYAVSGMNPDGSEYEGTLDITGDDVLALNWETGYDYQGVGLVEDSTLAIAWGEEGDCGLAVYRIQPDGVLEGRWTIQHSEEVGTETATRM